MSTNARLGFVASTGRTATMFLATTINDLPEVVAFHEGHSTAEPPVPKLPLINLQNRLAWQSARVAAEIVAERRNADVLFEAAAGAELVIDVAFYNAPLLRALAAHHPDAAILGIVRRCEAFVRSATITTGEDLQPAGWPEPTKPLSNREQFVALGRHRPMQGTQDAADWPSWSAVQRNIWLWHAVNCKLLATFESGLTGHLLCYEDLVDCPEQFWSTCLHALGVGTAENIASCVARSSSKLNARTTYQVGPLDTWTAAERELHARLALPLEEAIYDRAA